ncbi:MAG: hypothetical protein IPG06_14750 [Haliea sp.]|nr:hypothetical protein [Haliea sp.]
MHHIGVVSLFCIAFAPMQWRKQGTASKILLSTLFLFLVSGIGRALNFPPFTEIDALPILQSIQPGYWGCLVAMSACILVGMGVQRLQEEDLSRGALKISILVSGLLIAMFIAIGFVLDWKRDDVTSWYIGIFTLLCLVMPMLLAGQQKYLKITLRFIVVVFLFSELFFYLNTTRPQRSELPPTDEHFVLFADQVRDANFRTLSVGRGDLPPEWGVAYGIRQADGFRESVLPWYKEYFYKAFGKPSQDLSFDVGEELSLQLPLANYLGVKHFIVNAGAVRSLALMQSLSFPVIYEDARVKVFENSSAQPRARLLFEMQEGTVPTEAQNGSLLNTLYSNDASFLKAAKILFSVQAPGEKSGQATILEESNMRVLVKTRSNSASILSLADAWHPNWEVRVDGEKTNIGLINDAFRGVALSAGEHIVDFNYRIPGANFIQLFLVGGCALFVFISLLLWNTNRKRLGEISNDQK